MTALTLIESAKNLNQAYKILLPIVQKMSLIKNPTQKNEEVIFLFECVSTSKSARKEFRRTLPQVIERFNNLKTYRGL